MLRGLRSAMEQRERTHVLSSVVEFDDAYLDGQKKGGKGGRETEKAKIFVTLSLNKRGDSQYPKMSITKNIKQASAKRFAQDLIAPGIYHRQITGDSLRTGGEAHSHRRLAGARWRQRNWRPVHWCGISRISGVSRQRWGITYW